MIYDWYRIFNADEFLDLDLVEKTYVVNLEGVGEVSVRACIGSGLAIVYDDVFLPLDLDLGNPVSMDGYAAYRKENGDVYLGIEVESED